MDLKRLAKWADAEQPLLLALSGGADSRALFHLLLEGSYPFGVAHVDHGWRSESRVEAEALQELVKGHGLPFHRLTLDPKELKGNLEDACRQLRLEFFRGLCQEFGYSAVLLAHHADDQAETVCKRILEGAPLSQLAGMQEESQFQGMTLLRPLLPFSKSAILKWLNEKKIPYFEDATNSDPRFLRARMRSVLLPDLSRTFGKEIRPSFQFLGEESAQLKAYLDRRIEPYLSQVEEDESGSFLKAFPEEEVELKHLLRVLCRERGASPPRPILAQVVRGLREKAVSRRFYFGGISILVDRGRLIFISEKQRLQSFSKY